MTARPALARHPAAWLAAGAVAAVVLLALGWAAWKVAPSGGRSARPIPVAGGPGPWSLARPTYAKVLGDTQDAITRGEPMVQGDLRSTLVPLEVVSLYTERARLTGNYEDYGRAEALLTRIQAGHGESESVCLARARLHYTLHRLALAKQVLDTCPKVTGRPEGLSMLADIAFYTGHYADAGTIYRALVDQTGSPQAYIQLALYSMKTGAPGEALAYFEAAENRYHGGSALQESWLALQRGLVELDRGRYDEARALFALADERLPGYWLNEEHMAEATKLKGDTAAAKKIYEAVVKKTGAPEYLDALGAIEAEAGQAPQAKALFDRAEAIYTDRAKRFPEAIAGHALEHYLKDAPQPAKALELAEANFKNRPYGDAAIALAKAHLLNDRPREAARLLEQQLAAGWDTAETWQVLALAAEASGDKARAKTAAEQAVRRNPNAATQYAFKF